MQSFALKALTTVLVEIVYLVLESVVGDELNLHRILPISGAIVLGGIVSLILPWLWRRRSPTERRIEEEKLRLASSRAEAEARVAEQQVKFDQMAEMGVRCYDEDGREFTVIDRYSELPRNSYVYEFAEWMWDRWLIPNWLLWKIARRCRSRMFDY